MANYERGGGSQIDKTTCWDCGKQHFGKYIVGANGFFDCDKYD